MLSELENYKKKQGELANKLSEVIGMTKEEAKHEPLDIDFAKELRRLEEEAKEKAEEKSKRIIGISIQRFAGKKYKGLRANMWCRFDH